MCKKVSTDSADYNCVICGYLLSRSSKLLRRQNRVADVLTPKGDAFRTTLANDYDRELVQKALKVFTPRNTTHIPLAPDESLLEKLIEDSTLTDWDFKHSLLDPDCGGMDELILQHNKLYARYGEELENPNLRLFLPEFDGYPTPPVDRFKAPKLTDNEILLLNERHKSSGSRADEVDDLLSDFYEGGVDRSIIEVFDDWPSSANENAPLPFSGHGSHAKDNQIRILFLEAGGHAMEKSEIERMIMHSINLSYLTEWGPRPSTTVHSRMLLALAVHLIDSDVVEKVDWNHNYKNVFRDNIDERVSYASLRVLSWLEGSTAHWNSVVPNDSPTVRDFIKRSISKELTQPWTRGYPFTNIYWADDSHKLSTHKRRCNGNRYFMVESES